MNKHRSISSWLRLGALLFPVLLVSACSSNDDSGSSHTLESGKALMLQFAENEPNIEPYGTRMLINDSYIRIDDGGAQSDFVLYDREKHTVYSVTHEDHTVLVVNKKPMATESPMPLELDARKSEHPDAPQVYGSQPIQYTLTVNGETCSEIMVVPGMLDEAVVALREFRRTMAGQHAENLDKTPPDMLNPCFVAHHVIAPVRHLQYGFPVQQWGADGTTRSLVNYDEDFDVDAALFELPDGYRRVGIGPGGVKARPGDAGA